MIRSAVSKFPIRGSVATLVLLGASAVASAQACASSAPTASSTAPSAATLWVAPYHPCYQWNDVPAGQVPWGSITHLIVGYMLPQAVTPSQHTIVPPDWYGTQAWFNDAQQYVTAGHQAGRKVTCMLGGEGSNPGNVWNQATSVANVATFAANITSVLRPRGFDGVDLDWEDNVDYAGLVRLAQQLRIAWPEAVITIPTGFTGEDADNLAPAAAAVDAFMPMTYIAIPQWGGWTLPSPLTPLQTVGANRNSIDGVRQAWTNAGVPMSKLVMGVGGFGLVWGDTNGDGQAPILPYSSDGSGLAAGEGGGIVSDNAVTQAWLNETLAEHPTGFTEAWDAAQKISYWHSASVSQQVTVDELYCVLWNNCTTTAEVSLIFYETPRSMREKRVYVEQHAMKGMMFWTLSQMRDGTSYPILQSLDTVFSDGFDPNP